MLFLSRIPSRLLEPLYRSCLFRATRSARLILRFHPRHRSLLCLSRSLATAAHPFSCPQNQVLLKKEGKRSEVQAPSPALPVMGRTMPVM